MKRRHPNPIPEINRRFRQALAARYQLSAETTEKLRQWLAWSEIYLRPCYSGSWRIGHYKANGGDPLWVTAWLQQQGAPATAYEIARLMSRMQYSVPRAHRRKASLPL